MTAGEENLRGYRIVDPHHGQRYRFSRTVLRPGSSVVLHTGNGSNRPGHRYWRQNAPMWNDDGGTALLKNPNNTVVDRCSTTMVIRLHTTADASRNGRHRSERRTQPLRDKTS